MVLSVLQAFSAKQSEEISWDEYIHILLTRLTGVRHPEDSRNVEGIYAKIRTTDPFGYSIWLWSNRMDAINDISALEAVFKAFRHGIFDDVKAKFALLQHEGVPGVGIERVKRALALLACQERRADVLKFCLDQGGFHIEAALEEEAESVDADNDPETSDVLQQSHQFQMIRAWNEWNRCRPGGGCRFDVGGRSAVDW